MKSSLESWGQCAGSAMVQHSEAQKVEIPAQEPNSGSLSVFGMETLTFSTLSTFSKTKPLPLPH